jgi:hypothetical protein
MLQALNFSAFMMSDLPNKHIGIISMTLQRKIHSTSSKVTIVFQMLLTKKHKVIITHPCRQQQKNAGIFFNACNQHKRREEETLQWLKGQA